MFSYKQDITQKAQLSRYQSEFPAAATTAMPFPQLGFAAVADGGRAYHGLRAL
jgi:hypothetical protein